ncbi:MAG: helix-turn-helix transcriptional regulator [Alphaproteobacteria bacterium]|nr:helix-turn-helix transcriptional regulator [Alphaproteobacteria bacterium]
MSDSDTPTALAKEHFGQEILAEAKQRQAIHRHSDARLVLYVGGMMREDAFEGQARFARGDFVFRPAYFAHANVADADGSKYKRVPVSEIAVRRWVAKHGWCASCGHVDPDRLPHGDEILAASRPQPYVPLPPTTVMDRAAILLSDGAAPTAREVAARLNMEPYELTRRFTRMYGLSPSVYRRQACLQRAVRMLLERSAPLAQVATFAGYHDQSHLTVAFRRAFGLTPGAFAKHAVGVAPSS